MQCRWVSNDTNVELNKWIDADTKWMKYLSIGSRLLAHHVMSCA